MFNIINGWGDILPYATLFTVLLVSIGFSSFIEWGRYRFKFCPTDRTTLVRLSSEEARLATPDRLRGDGHWERMILMNAIGAICAWLAALCASTVGYVAIVLGSIGILVFVPILFRSRDHKLAQHYLERARSHSENGKPDLAIRDFSEARLLSSRVTREAISSRGDVFLDLGYLRQARADFHEAYLWAPPQQHVHMDEYTERMRSIRKKEFLLEFEDADEGESMWIEYERLEREEARKQFLSVFS